MTSWRVQVTTTVLGPGAAATWTPSAGNPSAQGYPGSLSLRMLQCQGCLTLPWCPGKRRVLATSSSSSSSHFGQHTSMAPCLAEPNSGSPVSFILIYPLLGSVMCRPRGPNAHISFPPTRLPVCFEFIFEISIFTHSILPNITNMKKNVYIYVCVCVCV